MDNRYYVNGVKDANDEVVIPALNKEERAWLNKFNKEYYNASFENDGEDFHAKKTSGDNVKEIKKEIKLLKKNRMRYTSKKAEKTTNLDRKKVSLINAQIEELEEMLSYYNPKKSCEDANNSRNRCLLNVYKASNIADLVPWEDVIVKEAYENRDSED